MSSYNQKDKNSILKYARKIIGKTSNDIINSYYEKNMSDDGLLTVGEDSSDYGSFNRKGGLGELVEKYYFGLELDNLSRPDFYEAGIELKTSPYRVNKNKTLSAKERLVITMINYFDIVKEELENSSLWSKIQNILLIYYLYEEDKDRLDYIFNYVYMYSPNKNDFKIIQKDYIKIKQKVLEGKAHELSEGDTMYLGATTKAADSSKLTGQPFSGHLAKPRAFSFKNSYMTALLRERISKQKTESIIKNETVDDFEEYIINKINKNIGLTREELRMKYLDSSYKNSKSIFNILTYKMLGVRKEKALEFEKANIVVKTIRLTKNNKIKESMSFPTFKVKELIKEEWENSTVNEFFNTTKFLFVVYKEFDDTFKLHGSIFWNMPTNDIENTLKNEWENAVRIFKEGVEFTPKQRGKETIISTNLPKLNNTEILHVRNHSQKSVYVIDNVKYGNGEISRDGDELPNGDIISKQCFWLNNKYILKQINKIIHNT